MNGEIWFSSGDLKKFVGVACGGTKSGIESSLKHRRLLSAAGFHFSQERRFLLAAQPCHSGNGRDLKRRRGLRFEDLMKRRQDIRHPSLSGNLNGGDADSVGQSSVAGELQR